MKKKVLLKIFSVIVLYFAVWLAKDLSVGVSVNERIWDLFVWILINLAVLFTVYNKK